MKFLKENFWWIVLIIVTIGLLVPSFYLPNTEAGEMLKKILLSPFNIIGAITIIAGIMYIIELCEKITKHTWQVGIIFIILALSIIVLTNVI